MIFKPPYWYHDNIQFRYEDLKELKFDIDSIGTQKYAKEKQHISTYFLKETQRPDKKFNDIYSTIVRNIVEKVGVFTPKARDIEELKSCLLYTSPSPRDSDTSRMPSSA